MTAEGPAISTVRIQLHLCDTEFCRSLPIPHLGYRSTDDDLLPENAVTLILLLSAEIKKSGAMKMEIKTNN